MNQNRLACACLGLLAAASFTHADDQPKPQQKPRSYANATAECETAIKSRTRELLDQYSSEVWNVKRRFQDRGDLEKALTADEEWSRVLRNKSLTTKDLVESPPELLQIQNVYVERLDRVRETTAEDFVRELGREAAVLAKEGKLAEGKVLQQELEKIRKLYLSTDKVKEKKQPQDSPPVDPVVACEEAIRQARVGLQARYVGELEAMEKSFQAKGELEHLFAAKAEHQRFLNTPILAEANLVDTPDALRELQRKHFEMMQSVTSDVAKQFIESLDQQKQVLTIDGKLEEAVAAKSSAEKLRRRYFTPPPPSVSRRNLAGEWQCYWGDRATGPCKLIQNGDMLTFINENGTTFTGRRLDDETVVAGTLRGKLSADGKLIEWENTSRWKR